MTFSGDVTCFVSSLQHNYPITCLCCSKEIYVTAVAGHCMVPRKFKHHNQSGWLLGQIELDDHSADCFHGGSHCSMCSYVFIFHVLIYYSTWHLILDIDVDMS